MITGSGIPARRAALKPKLFGHEPEKDWDEIFSLLKANILYSQIHRQRQIGKALREN